MKLPVPLVAAAVLIGAVVFIGRQLPKTDYVSKIPQANKAPKPTSTAH